MRELGFVAAGYDRELDASRAEAGAARNAIVRLQDRYVQETGIKSLKIRTNNVLGYHLEVHASSTKALGTGFTLRQGLASSTRYSTAELDRLATAHEAAIERAARIEETLFAIYPGPLSRAGSTVPDRACGGGAGSGVRAGAGCGRGAVV